VIGHAGGLPVEETLLPLMSSLGAGLFLARTWIAGRLSADDRKDRVRFGRRCAHP
jgi:hypothetical protein